MSWSRLLEAGYLWNRSPRTWVHRLAYLRSVRDHEPTQAEMTALLGGLAVLVGDMADDEAEDCLREHELRQAADLLASAADALDSAGEATGRMQPDPCQMALTL